MKFKEKNKNKTDTSYFLFYSILEYKRHFTKTRSGCGFESRIHTIIKKDEKHELSSIFF